MNARRDENPEIEWPKIPAETPYLASHGKRAVCGDWVVDAAVQSTWNICFEADITLTSSPAPGFEIQRRLARRDFRKASFPTSRALSPGKGVAR
jgi:hypothetical protein